MPPGVGAQDPGGAQQVRRSPRMLRESGRIMNGSMMCTMPTCTAMEPGRKLIGVSTQPHLDERLLRTPRRWKITIQP